ncbi:Tetraspanin-33 [Nymphon striatum]|nr:Tetraspanin-33 [Nymphon striatum]
MASSRDRERNYQEHRARRIAHMSIDPQSTYVSQCTKYIVFFFNLLFWVVGGLMVGVGLYAFLDRFDQEGPPKIESVFDVLLDVSIVIMVAGGIVFIISYAGCLGALRENTCLLQFFSYCLLVLFLIELAVAIAAFVFPEKLLALLKNQLSSEIIQKYRDPEKADLASFTDFIQREFKCCGLSDKGYKDWNKNLYFNCTTPEENPSIERCGVPYSCCRDPKNIDSGLINMMCGFGVLDKSALEAESKIFTKGCISSIQTTVKNNLYVVAGSCLGLALLQLFSMFQARSLQAQISAQKSRWT